MLASWRLGLQISIWKWLPCHFLAVLNESCVPKLWLLTIARSCFYSSFRLPLYMGITVFSCPFIFLPPLWRREMTHKAEREIEETRNRPPLDNEEDSSPLEYLFARLISSGLLSLLKVFSIKEEGGEKALSFLSSFFSLTCR